MKYAKTLAAAFAAIASFAAASGAVNVTVSAGTPKLGEWNSNFDEIIKIANRDHVPVVLLGSSTGCTYCNAFNKDVFTNEKFQNWVSAQPYYFCKVQAIAGNWTPKQLTNFLNLVGGGTLPRFSVYWNKPGEDEAASRKRTKSTTIQAAGKSVDWYIDFISKQFAEYSADSPDDDDPRDDTPGGATVLDIPADGSEAVTGEHTLYPEADSPDRADWFKMSCKTGERYRLEVRDLVWETAAPAITVSNATTRTKILSETADALAAGVLFTPRDNAPPAAETDEILVSVSYPAGKGGASYKLAYRLFENLVFSIPDREIKVNEDAGTLSVDIVRSGRPADPAVATLAVTPGTAKPGTDYRVSGTNVTFAAGSDKAVFRIQIIDIPGAQGDKTFSISVSGEDTGEGNDTSAAVTIIDLDKETATDDNTPETARQCEMSDETATSGAGTVGPSDKTDCYRLSPVSAGRTYQIKAPDYSARPAGSPAPSVAVYSVSGSATSEVCRTDLPALAKTPFRFVQENDGELLVKVEDGTAADSKAVYRYSLAWQEWVLPVAGFESTELSAVSPAAGSQKFTVALKRAKNLEEAVTVPVTVSSSDPRVGSGTLNATFAAGSDKAEITLSIGADGGFWTADAAISLEIADPGTEAPTYAADPQMQAARLTVSSSMPEYDAYDGDGPAKLDPPAKRSAKIQATLNGSDTEDVFEFDVKGGTEYAFRVDKVFPETEEPPFTAFLTADGAQKEISAEEYFGASYRFVPAADGTAKITFAKRDGAPECVMYSFSYREWVPATISLEETQIITSELASSVAVGVKCSMETPTDVSVVVKTADGTAVAGEDFAMVEKTLSWNEDSPTSSVTYVSVPLKKLLPEYEGLYETFKIVLDFSASDAIPGETTETEVIVLEADVGEAGTFNIDGWAADGKTNAYRSAAATVTAGRKAAVKIARTGDRAGTVTATLSWADRTTAGTAVFEDLETEKWIEIDIPASDGECKPRTSAKLTLSTNEKSAKTGRSSMTFSIIDDDIPLSQYRQPKTRLPFSAGANGWYATSDGAIRTKTLAARKSATALLTLKGEGTLFWKGTVHGSGTLDVKIGGKTAEPDEDGGVHSVAIPQGTQRVTFTFTAESADSWFEISEEDIEYAPSAAFYRTGTFNGEGSLGDAGGPVTFTATAKGRVSGKFTLCDGKTATFTGTLEDGSAVFDIRKGGRNIIEDAELSIDDRGFWTISAGGEVFAEGGRNGWADRPLTGNFALYADLPGARAALEATDGETPVALAFRISAGGTAAVAGKIGKRAFSQSAPVFFKDGEDAPLATLADKYGRRFWTIRFERDGAGGWTAEPAAAD